jgi:glutamate-1-semialdehyde 2,1-aminomutase
MTSEELFSRAGRSIPGGVNSPVRALKSVGTNPVYLKRGSGCKVYDVEDNEYIDFCGSWGPLILGHADPDVVAAVQEAAGNGLSFGTCNPLEVEFAELIKSMVPSLEMLRCVNSGTEAVMTAIRLARGVTGRKFIVKFDGGYHGHSDSLLVSAGSGLLTHGISSSAGVSDSTAAEVIVIPYNDIDAAEQVFARYGNEIATVIVEPIAGNMGLINPAEGFLNSLRQLTSGNGAMLIFDEVITGFRCGPTTFGEMFGIKADITCLGKIIGGGMPVGAVGGSAAVMNKLAPLGPVYQAGTLSGNPVALAAGIATLKKLRDNDFYPALQANAQSLAAAINAFATDNSLPVSCAWNTGMFTIFFRPSCPSNLAEVQESDTRRFAAFYRAMLKRGYYLSPSQYELNFISVAHTQQILERFCAEATEVIAELFRQ